MLINKKTKAKGKRRFIFGAVAFASLASMATMSLISCKQANDTTKPNESDKDLNDPVGFSVYAYLNFKVRASDAALGIKFIGDTSVKIKKGHHFGTANAPTVVCPGYTLSHWEDSEGNTISRNTVISDAILTNDALDVYPKVVPASTGMFISGRETIYDGVMFSEEPSEETGTYTLIESYDYVASVGGTTSYSGLTWTVTPGDDGQNINVTPDPTNPEVCHVTTRFTEEPVTDTLTATWNGYTQDIEITVLPPYYATGVLQMNPQTTVRAAYWDMGKSYWIIEDGEWMIVDANQICSEQQTSGVEFVYPIIWDDGGKEEEGKSVSVLKGSEDEFIWNWTDVYPGAAVTGVAPYFMAHFIFANPELHAGINEISSIGDGFLLDCQTFDQDIRDLFSPTTGMKPYKIGNYFMYGCSMFNNGQAYDTPYEWTLPYASSYGTNFLGDCTALEASLTLPTSITYIGSNFINNNDMIASFTIPSDCAIETIESNFLAYVENLTNLTIATDNVEYFADVEYPGTWHGAFVKSTAPSAINVHSSQEVFNGLTSIYPNYTTSYPYRNLVFAE